MRRGCPAFGWALTGTAEYRTRSSATTSIRCGPTVQLVPIIATGSADRTAATSRGVSPPRVCASSANVACAISGKLVTEAATDTASTSSSRYPNVSRISRSAAPSATRARICSRSTSIRSAAPTRRRCGAVTAGETEPATRTFRPERSAAARASRTPARLISATLSGKP